MTMDLDIPAVVEIDDRGRLAFLWDDRLVAFRDLGELRIDRASYVEPTPEGYWMADLAPLGGPRLGPFSLHGAAIEAEREWIARHRGL